MIVSTRAHRLDMLSAEEKGYKLLIHTHRNEIVVNIEQDGKTTHYSRHHLPELCQLLESANLLKQ